MNCSPYTADPLQLPEDRGEGTFDCVAAIKPGAPLVFSERDSLVVR